ncbi:MAG: AgmX/PglI C-terminal domain-containing protein [Cystobacterineae bacterium]|nr:AgmX/PglI C-terminal domain-containing protein [Cystobacterineae bacterium]
MIKDEKVGPKGVKVRCKKCSHLMTVRLPDLELPDLELSDEATIRIPLPEEDESESFFAADLSPGASAEPSAETPSPFLSAFDEGLPTGTHLVSENADGLSENFEFSKSPEEEHVSEENLPFMPPIQAAVPPADLGSLFDDPELKSPSTGLFGSLDEEELGDAFERAISQRKSSALQQSASGALFSEPSIVVSQGLSQPAGVEWFVAVDDNQVGPLGMGEIKSYWRQGKISRDSLCWKSGMKDWEPIGALEELFDQLNVSAISTPGIELSPPPESEAAPVDWQPSAASALASLVQDELQGMAASPPALEPHMAPLAEAAPSYTTNITAALTDIPSASPAVASALTPPYITAPPAPAYAAVPATNSTQTSAIYIPPAPPPARPHKAIWLLSAGLLLVFGVVVAILVVLLRSPEKPQPPPPVMAQPTPQLPPPPPPPPPPAIEETPPVVRELVPPPSELPQIDPSQALAERFAPPPKPPKKQETKRNTSQSVASVAPPPARPSTSRVQDDFDKAFGVADPPARSTRQERPTTVYVPPPVNVKQALSDADIMEYILSKKAEVLVCVREQKNRDPKLKGDMIVEWNVATSGKTSQVKLAASSSFQGTYFANCVIKLIQTWQFPAHRTAGGTRKFNFKI